jgi:hypothetical protein
MKKLICVLLLASSCFAINPFTYNWTIKLTGDTATVAKWKANNDSVINWAARISDTLTNQVYRKVDFSNHVPTFAWMNIDTIKGPVRIDTIKGNLRLDTVTTCTLDSIYGYPRIVNASANCFILLDGYKRMTTSVPYTGSLGSVVGSVSPTLTGTIQAANATFSGNVLADSVYSTKGIKATNFTGNLIGNASGTSATVTGAAQTAITSVGTLTGLTSSGTVSVDSLFSTKGIKATNFTGNVIGNVTGNTSGTAATVTGAAQTAITSVGTLTGLTSSGTVSVDSLFSTKGIKATNFTGNVIGGKATIDSFTVGGGDWIGKIFVDTGHTHATSPDKLYISLPTGFTTNNCMIMSFCVNVSSTGWDCTSGAVNANIDPDNQYSIHYSDISTHKDKKYRICFMKISK